jgi:hypothetical protein
MPKRQAKPTKSPPFSAKPEELEALGKAYGERKISLAPKLIVKNNAISYDHPDQPIGYLLVQTALGTVDRAFMSGLLRQLVGASSAGTEIDETDLNFMVSVIKGIEPRDQMESMLAAQMAAIHMAAMTFSKRLGKVQNLPQQDSSQRAFNQLVRTFSMQLEALRRYRTGGEQKVTVHHVSVNQGGQAIVGNVTREIAPDITPSQLTHSKAPAMEIMGEPPCRAAPVRRKLSK